MQQPFPCYQFICHLFQRPNSIFTFVHFIFRDKIRSTSKMPYCLPINCHKVWDHTVTPHYIGPVLQTFHCCHPIHLNMWRAQWKNDETPFLKKMSYDVFLIGEFNLNILVKTAWRYSNSKYFFSNFDVTLVAYFSSLSLLTKMKKTQKCSKWAWNHTNLLKIL